MNLNQLQYGKESPSGTAVVATKRILGSMNYVPDQQAVIPADDIGKNVPGYRAVKGGKLVANSILIERGYFQILPLIFSLLLKGGITPAEQTTDQEDYLWAFDPDLTATGNTPDTITLESGDAGVQGFETEYVVFEKVKISGSVPQDGRDAPIKIDIDFFGKQNTKTTFTAAIAPPVVNEMSGFLTRLYVNDSWAAVGTTEKTNILRAFDIEIIGGFAPAFHGGQSLTFDAVVEGKKSILVTLTLDSGADAMALHDALGEVKFLKLLFEGPAIGTGDKHSLAIKFAGVVMDPKLNASYENDVPLTTVQLEGVYDPTGGKMFTVDVTTNSATI
ncbi:MAG: hypothetical protein GYA45_11600 [Pelolinea sp.]|nr:hypothetical protein [Pelolinea sp.]